MSEENWRAKAESRWGSQATWISGDGRFALLAPCRHLSVSLYDTREEAENAKVSLAEIRCGGGCNPSSHELVDLAEG